jgi:hypothetical protein
MLQLFFITFFLLILGIFFLGINIFFFKKKFPNNHVGGQKALIDKGITCVIAQDFEARQK